MLDQMGNLAFAVSALHEMRHAHRALLPAAITAAVTVASSTFSRSAGLSPLMDSVLWWLLVAPVTNAGSFFIATSMLKRTPSLAGLIRYSALMYLAGIPLIFIDVLLSTDFLSSNMGDLTGLVAFLVLYLALYLVAIAVLQAWPLANALKTDAISLPRIWAATKGYRLSLILSAVIVLIPLTMLEDYFSSHIDVAENPLPLFGEAITAIMFLLVASAINITAWQYAVARDPALRPD